MAKKKVYDKFVDGDSLTNAEVLEGIARGIYEDDK